MGYFTNMASLVPLKKPRSSETNKQTLGDLAVVGALPYLLPFLLSSMPVWLPHVSAWLASWDFFFCHQACSAAFHASKTRCINVLEEGKGREGKGRGANRGHITKPVTTVSDSRESLEWECNHTSDISLTHNPKGARAGVFIPNSSQSCLKITQNINFLLLLKH